MDGLDGKAAQLELVAGMNLHQLGAAQQIVLFQLVLDQADGQLGCIDGQVHLLEQVGQRADVILMAVGDYHALDLILVLHHIGEVRNDQIDAEHVAVRKNQAAVHDEHVSLALIQGDVFAHFTQTAQRNNVHRHSLFLLIVIFGSRLAAPGIEGAAALSRLLRAGILGFGRGRLMGSARFFWLFFLRVFLLSHRSPP